ncbi:MAG TPA: hypothetical protein VK034_10050 [Enhygromyxa sp.]|nr:hypothetical protein [Enhygromyxa sp.]
MDIARLNAQIETAVAVEANEGHLASYLTDRAAERGRILADKERREALELFENYIRSVPALLATASSSAAGTPVEAIMAKVMQAAVTYWDEPDDLVPDELGVLGLLDDAYFSLRMLQMVSDRLREESGQALIADDLSALDDVVRDIIGDHLADILDDLVILSLSNAPVDELIATVEQHSGSFILASAQTSFTGLSVLQLVEERLSFTGKRGDSLRGELIAALEQFAGKLDGRASPELVRDGTEVIGRTVRTALGEDAGDDQDSDLDIIVALLVGGVVSRVMLGRGCDREFIEDCVDFVVGGVV